MSLPLFAWAEDGTLRVTQFFYTKKICITFNCMILMKKELS